MPTAVIDAVLALGPRLVAITLGGDGAILATENNGREERIGDSFGLGRECERLG
ncbi:hypothetical protein GCM10009775_17010 [Microbacterium aoyamense]|uniref:Fructokinase n=1 Tax=Microbacterium aoyamense TaxID=344166 RepID=A0ABP5AY08_9MICO